MFIYFAWFNKNFVNYCYININNLINYDGPLYSYLFISLKNIFIMKSITLAILLFVFSTTLSAQVAIMSAPDSLDWKKIAETTVSFDQNTVDKEGNEAVVSGKGRHDPCVVPRAVPIVEAMAALVIADFYLRAKTSKL